MNEIPINRTCSIIEQSNRRKKIEITAKRRYYIDYNTSLLVPINCEPQDVRIYNTYKFEVLNHDLHLAFAPSEKRLPFMRITDPKSGGSWALWFIGFGDDANEHNPIKPILVDKGNGFVQWRLADGVNLKLEIMGHKIRKLIILDKRPGWNKLKFRIARGGSNLIDGLAVGCPEKRLMAFRKGANLGFDNPLFWFTEPSAYDSNIENPNYTNPQYTLTPIKTGIWDMEIILDTDWLDAAQYPVYVDPTIVLQPDATEGKDTYGQSNYPTTNYGTYTYISNRNGGPGYMRRNAFIQFNLNSIPIGSAINSAELYLTCWSGYESMPHRTRAGRILENWEEIQATWNNRSTGVAWTNPGGDYEGTYADEGGDSYGDTSLETASLVQLWVDGTYSNYGYHLRDDYYIHYGTYYSSDYGTASVRPKLTITYTDGGGGMPAGLSALAGMRILHPLAIGII